MYGVKSICQVISEYQKSLEVIICRFTKLFSWFDNEFRISFWERPRIFHSIGFLDENNQINKQDLFWLDKIFVKIHETKVGEQLLTTV